MLHDMLQEIKENLKYLPHCEIVIPIWFVEYLNTLMFKKTPITCFLTSILVYYLGIDITLFEIFVCAFYMNLFLDCVYYGARYFIKDNDN